MTTTAVALRPVVDALVAQPVEGLCVSELQAQIADVAQQAERLAGWLSVASGQLQALTGGTVPTAEGGFRSVAGWLAEQRRETPSAAGSRLKTSALLRSLPLVAAAVLDGVLTQGQAQVLSRLVGKIDEAALRESEPNLIKVAAPLDPAELGAYVQHLIATHCEPVLEDECEDAAGRRFLQTTADGGLLRGRFALPAEDGEAFLTALEPLAARDGGCAVRGCTRPPAGCDAHHLTHRADGGQTSMDNLVNR